MTKEKITFTDRDDLIKKLMVKKSDVSREREGLINSLQKAIQRIEHGDKTSINKVLELRKQMLTASSELYIEIDENKAFSLTVAELSLLEEIEFDE